MIRTCIVSNFRLYSEGLRQILGGQRRIAVVATLDYGEHGLEEAARVRPDVVLIDVSAAEGEAALRRFVEELPDARVVAVAVSDSEAQVVACAEAGVSGFVSRTSSLDELIAAVEAVSQEETPCSPRIAAILLRRVQSLSRRPEIPGPAAKLTRRQREILDLVSLGYSNKAIARRLSIELSTVKNHVHQILEKLDVHARTEAAALVGSAPDELARRRNGHGV